MSRSVRPSRDTAARLDAAADSAGESCNADIARAFRLAEAEREARERAASTA